MAVVLLGWTLMGCGLLPSAHPDVIEAWEEGIRTVEGDVVQLPARIDVLERNPTREGPRGEEIHFRAEVRIDRLRRPRSLGGARGDSAGTTERCVETGLWRVWRAPGEAWQAARVGAPTARSCSVVAEISQEEWTVAARTIPRERWSR